MLEVTYVVIILVIFALVALALSRVGSQAERDIDREMAERARRRQDGGGR